MLGNNDLEVRELTSAFDKIGGELRGEFCEIEQDKLVLQYIMELTQEEGIAHTMWQIIQYIVYSSTLKGTEYGKSTAGQLKKHASQELSHALEITRDIDYLGEDPTMKSKEAEYSQDPKDNA